MKTIYYNPREIEEIIQALKRGEIIAFPTDTVFGLGCIYDCPEAIQAIKNAKNRDAHKPLPMMCSSLEMIETVAVVNDYARKLYDAFCPGPLTMIMPKKDNCPAYVNNGMDTLGIRVPNDSFILEMIQTIGKPLLVTSANLSGEPSLKTYREVNASLNGKINGLVKADAQSETASTIVDTQTLQVLRVGALSPEEIAHVLQ